MELWQICLICGAIGLLIVLLISLSTGIGNGNLTPALKFDDKCDKSKKVELPPRHASVKDKSSYKLSTFRPPGSCPVGYTFFTDLDGNSLCCGSPNINIYERTCSARGKEGVCSLVPGIVDTRDDSYSSKTYPMCYEIAESHQLRESGSFCPAKYKYHVTLGTSNTEWRPFDIQQQNDVAANPIFKNGTKDQRISALTKICEKINGTWEPHGPQDGCIVKKSNYKCCSSHVNPGATDCNSGSKFCTGLQQGQTIFNTPYSCENAVILESIECPDNTHLIPDFKMPKIGSGSVAPICIGAKGNCIPRKIIEEGQKIGLFTDIDINTNIMNCDVYDKYYNERSLGDSQLQTKVSKDL